MRRMARSAVGRDNQSLLEEGLTVDTLREILQNMILVNRALSGHQRSFLVAFPTQEWDLERRDRRTLVFRGEYIVVAVAIVAMRGQGVASCNRFAVKRFCMQLLLGRVAGSTFYFLKAFRVR